MKTIWKSTIQRQMTRNHLRSQAERKKSCKVITMAIRANQYLERERESGIVGLATETTDFQVIIKHDRVSVLNSHTHNKCSFRLMKKKN